MATASITTDSLFYLKLEIVVALDRENNKRRIQARERKRWSRIGRQRRAKFISHGCTSPHERRRWPFFVLILFMRLQF